VDTINTAQVPASGPGHDHRTNNADRFFKSLRKGGGRRTAAKVASIGAVAAFGSMALGIGGGGVASAAEVVPVSYGSATFCQTITSATSTYTWQQELEGLIPTTTTEELYVGPPQELNYYPGSASVAWIGEVEYQAANGVWTQTQLVGTTANTASYYYGTLQHIGWGQTTSFVVGVNPGYRYAVYGITEWRNAAGQQIAISGGWVPNSNC